MGVVHCGCCDRPQGFAVCEACQEPVCASCFRRVLIGTVEEVQYRCVICAEAMLAVGAIVEATPAQGAALAAMAE